MRSTSLSLLLVVALSACSSATSSTARKSPPPTATPGQQVIVHHFPTATPGAAKHPFPTANPKTPPPKLPTVRVATPTAPLRFPASAYTASVYGTVTDAKTHTPIAGATVQVADGQRTTRSDAKGRYRVLFPSRATASLQVRKTGYTCGLAMGALKPRQQVKKDWQCQRIIPNHPVPPPFPSFIGTPAPGSSGPPPPKG